MSKLWAFLSNSDNRATLAWLSGAMVAVVTALWTVYLHFSPTPLPKGAPTPAVQVPAAVDQAAVERLRKSQEEALKAETCALENVTRRISGLEPLPCPAPATSR